MELEGSKTLGGYSYTLEDKLWINVGYVADKQQSTGTLEKKLASFLTPTEKMCKDAIAIVALN